MNMATLTDADTELALIGSMLVKPSVVSELTGIITPDDFSDPYAATLYRVFVLMDADGRPIDDPHVLRDTMLSIGERFDAGYIGTAMNETPHAQHATTYAETVRDLSNRRKTIKCRTSWLRSLQTVLSRLSGCQNTQDRLSREWKLAVANSSRRQSG